MAARKRIQPILMTRTTREKSRPLTLFRRPVSTARTWKSTHLSKALASLRAVIARPASRLTKAAQELSLPTSSLPKASSRFTLEPICTRRGCTLLAVPVTKRSTSSYSSKRQLFPKARKAVNSSSWTVSLPRTKMGSSSFRASYQWVSTKSR